MLLGRQAAYTLCILLVMIQIKISLKTVWSYESKSFKLHIPLE